MSDNEFDLADEKLQEISQMGNLLLQTISKKNPKPDTYIDENGVEQKLGTYVEDSPGQLDKAIFEIKSKIQGLANQL